MRSNVHLSKDRNGIASMGICFLKILIVALMAFITYKTTNHGG